MLYQIKAPQGSPCGAWVFFVGDEGFEPPTPSV